MSEVQETIEESDQAFRGVYKAKCEYLIREGICSPYQAELCGGRDKDGEGYCTAIYVDTGIEE